MHTAKVFFDWGGFSGFRWVVRGCRKAGPAGLQGLLKSPPHLAGQVSAPLRATPAQSRPRATKLKTDNKQKNPKRDFTLNTKRKKKF